MSHDFLKRRLHNGREKTSDVVGIVETFFVIQQNVGKGRDFGLERLTFVVQLLGLNVILLLKLDF